jgi:hypothetical protein
MMRDLYEIEAMFGALDGYDRYHEASSAWAVRQEQVQQQRREDPFWTVRQAQRNERVQQQRREDPSWPARNAAYQRARRARLRENPDAYRAFLDKQNEWHRRRQEARVAR